MSARFAEKRDTISCRYHASMTPAHTFVAQACLGIFVHLDKNVTEDVLKKFPLAEYDAEHSVEHYEDMSANAEEGIKQLFDRSKRHLAVGSGFTNQIGASGDTHDLKGHRQPSEAPYFMPLFVASPPS